MTMGGPSEEQLVELRRNSALRLDREGRWSLNGRPVEHPRVARLFHRGVRPAGDGQYTLHVGRQWAFIQHLDDTAYFVARARPVGGELRMVLASGDEERLDPATLTTRGPEDVYCRLGNGHRARFLRDALAALMPLLEEREGAVGLLLAGRFHPLADEE